VLVDVRSTVGPLSFGAIGLTGTVDATVVGGELDLGVAPTAHLTIDVSRLSSGNELYDAELHRRIDARRFPTATVVMDACEASGPGARYRLSGEVTFHGVTRPAKGTVTVEATSSERLVITGEQVFDIRDYSVPSPTVLMLRIYPDVRVRLHVEADRQPAPGLARTGLDEGEERT
jgi:polyisoprenoid-binding protein YceI